MPAAISSQIGTHITSFKTIIDILELLLLSKERNLNYFENKRLITEDKCIITLHDLYYQVKKEYATYDKTFQQLPTLCHGKKDLEIAEKMFKDELLTHKDLINKLTPNIHKNIDDLLTILEEGIDRNEIYLKQLRLHESSLTRCLRSIHKRGPIPSSIAEVIALSDSRLEQWSQQYDRFGSCSEDEDLDMM